MVPGRRNRRPRHRLGRLAPRARDVHPALVRDRLLADGRRRGDLRGRVHSALARGRRAAPGGGGRSRPGMTAREHHVVIVGYPGVELLDIAGPVSVFTAATRLTRAPGYRVVVARTAGGASSIATANAVRLD